MEASSAGPRTALTGGADFPAVLNHISNFDICHIVSIGPRTALTGGSLFTNPTKGSNLPFFQAYPRIHLAWKGEGT